MNRREFEAAQRRTVHRGKGKQSSVYEVDWNGQRAAVKDFSRVPWLFRNLVVPLIIRREIKALRWLDGTPGVPRFLGRVDRLAFALEYVEGTPFDQLKTGDIGPEVFPRIQAVIDGIHARGVSHGDLKRRSNLLLTPSGEVFLIDFAAAVIGNRPLHPFASWLQHEMEAVDRKSLPKIKKFTAPDQMTEEDVRLLNTPTRLERWARKWLGR